LVSDAKGFVAGYSVLEAESMEDVSHVL